MEKLLQIISTRREGQVNGRSILWAILLFSQGLLFLNVPAFAQGISPGANNILYVDRNVNTGAAGYTGAGNSWANAVPQLAEVLKWAREEYAGGGHGWSGANPLRIFVAKGVYLPAYHVGDQHYATDSGRYNGFVLVRDVQLYGGFDPANGIDDLDDVRIQPNVASPGQGTVLSGDLGGNDSPDNFDSHSENAHHVIVSGGNVGVARLDGFTVSGGGTDDGSPDLLPVNGQPVQAGIGAGFYIANSSPFLFNCLFYRNFSTTMGAGGCVYGTGSEPTLSKCTFYGNSSQSGGGVANLGATAIFNECVFSENVAVQGGGGALNMQAGPSFNNCQFIKNSADAGAGMGNQQSNPTVNNSTFVENTSRNGGGMTNGGGGTITLNGCRFSGNTATGDGGGLHNIQTEVHFSKCIFEQNRADQRGGAMRNDRTTATIKDSRITANNAPQGGGIINESCPSILIMNSIMSGNTAQMGAGMFSGLCGSILVANSTVWGNVGGQYGGGGLLNAQSPMTVANTIIWNNEAIGVTNSPEASISTMGGQLPVITNSLVANWGGSDNWDDARGTDGGGNIDTDPGFASVAPADANFLYLTDSSPARDAGSNNAYTAAGGNLANDQDLAGNPRSFGPSIDMGAYENQQAVPDASVLYVDAQNGDDSASGTSWGTAFRTLSYALKLANADTDVDSILVAGGTYYPTGTADQTNRDSTFHIARGGIKLYGGYDAASGQRNLAENRSTLSGAIGAGGSAADNSYHVMVIAGIPAEADSIIVDGFAITDGYANGNATGTYNGVTVLQYYGAGIYSIQNGLGSKLRLESLLIQNNLANYGGGMFNDEQSSPLVVNCQITGNAAVNNGGGMLNRNTSSPGIINCTIAGNKAGNGGGIFNNFNASPAIHNSIVYGNSTGVVSQGGSSPTVTYSLVQGQSGGVGNVDGGTSPGFVDPASYEQAPGTGGDYSLEACSPAINGGANALLAAGVVKDINGKLRRAHSVVDLGASEYQGTLRAGVNALARNDDESIRTISGITSFQANGEVCRLIARLEPTGAGPVSGTVTARVEIDAEVAFYKGSPYVQRHYQINAPAGGSARITLYFTQEEFDRFSDELPSGPLPGNATDEANKSNLRVFQYEGTTGSEPGDYQGALSIIDPDDQDIRWNAVMQRWEVTFGVAGFSGFFIGSVASPLPVKLVSFTGIIDAENAITLDWRVVEQENIAAYHIQYSTNGRDFQQAGTVSATQTSEAVYTFRHDPPSGSAVVYYRLLISEWDGARGYSKIIALKIPDPKSAFVYPNPADEGFRVKKPGAAGTTASLVDISGSRLRTWKFKSDEEYVDIRSLQAGVYLILFNDGSSMKIVKK